jgi:hypothetical protein
MPLSGLKMERESFEAASERAMNEPVKFNPGERKLYVQTMINKTMEFLRKGLSVNEIKQRLPEFSSEYQHLFEMITSPDGFDHSNLTIMLQMLDHMDKGAVSQHNASVIVGKKLYETYGHKTTENEKQ